jgi:hypothetical protein
MADALTLNGIAFQQQVGAADSVQGKGCGISYRIDFLVEGALLVELKTVERFLPSMTAGADVPQAPATSSGPPDQLQRHSASWTAFGAS